MKLRVMTFNTQHCLNFLTQKIDYEKMADTVRACAPDIVSLNEMRGKGAADGYDDQVPILAERTGMAGISAEAIRFEGESPYGNGLLSRFPVIHYEVIPIPAPEVKGYGGYYEDRCLLKAVLDLGGKPLTVMVIHYGLNPDEAERATDAVLENLPRERCVLMGDFNLTPDSPYIAKIRTRMQDAAEYAPEDTKSFPSDASKVKIDYIFVSRDIKILSSEVPPIVASDHRPHIADLEI